MHWWKLEQEKAELFSKNSEFISKPNQIKLARKLRNYHVKSLITIFRVNNFVFSGSEASCYFPAAFQGEYVTQSIMSGLPTISYSTLAVLSDSIPVWGTCHRRIGNNVILMDDTGGLTCYKCFNLVLRSSNVLQIHTAGLDKCYTTEERAMADCPSDMMIREQRAREIMLYRKFFLTDDVLYLHHRTTH